MTVATNANVTKLYIATFDRAPDGGGLNYWVNQSGLSLEQIAQSFFDQPETQSKYAGVDTLTFVKTIYENVLGRAGEQAGIDYWVGELNAGHITKDQAILAVIGGAQGTDADLLENKTQVGIYFAEHGQDNNPDAFAVIEETKLDRSSVDLCKQWIDGTLPAESPSQYNLLDDNRVDYDLTGSAKDDVYVVEAFKSAVIHGGDGSDSLDFQDYSPKGVNVNLSTGLGPIGAGGAAMTFDWIENIRGTSGDDTLVGNSDANILIAMGGTDNVDGGVGDDRLMFLNVEDVAKSTVNGGQNTDTLEITEQTAIAVNAATFANVSDVEILQVGYDEEGVPSAATITVTDPTAVSPLNTFKEIRGTESFDKKGNPANDIIQSANNLNVSNVKLTSIEELKALADDLTVTVGKSTLECVTAVTGFGTDTNLNGTGTTLALAASAGDVFDLTLPTFTNIDRVTLDDKNVAGVQGVASTVIVNQSLVNSLANTFGTDGFNGGNFSLSTLQASGIGMDLSVLADGDARFKAVNFGTAKEVTIGNINDGDNFDGAVDLITLRSITGSENQDDLLRVKPDAVHAQNLADVSTVAGQQAVTITSVERLDFEETSTVALDNVNLTDVKQISGDDDRNANPSQPAMAAAAAALNNIGGAAGTTTAAAAQTALAAAAASFTALNFPNATAVQLTAAQAAFTTAATPATYNAGNVAAALNAAAVVSDPTTAFALTAAANGVLGVGLTAAQIAALATVLATADAAAVAAADAGIAAADLVVNGGNGDGNLTVGAEVAFAQAAATASNAAVEAALNALIAAQAGNTVAVAQANVSVANIAATAGVVTAALAQNAAPAAQTAAENAVARTIIDAGFETDKGGLDLKGVKLQDIYGLGNNVSGKNGTVTIDTKTTWDSNFKDLDHDSNQTIIAAEAGSYDFSSIIESTGADVAFAPVTGVPTVTYYDKFVGSDGNDIVMGGTDSFGFELGKGNDTFNGTDTANETVEGGEGNDEITLGNNIETTDTLNLTTGGIIGQNTGRLINSLGLVGTSDYIGSAIGSGALAGTPVVLGDVANGIPPVLSSATFSREVGGYADGGAGDDKITSDKGDDVLLGGTGNDTIKGGEGRDIIAAGEGADILSGGKDHDFLAGGAGDDTLEGNAGNDFLFGGKGRDILRGDQLLNDDPNGVIEYLGRDTFIFEAGDSGTTESTVDIIKDFTGTGLAATPTIDLDGDGIKAGASDLLLSDVISVNWFGALPAGITTAHAVATDGTGASGAVAAGTAYQTFAYDATNSVAGQTSLLNAANAALDIAYNAQTLNTTLLAAEYTSQAVQFEYGGKEYVVVDAYVDRTGAATNNVGQNDLIVEIADAPVLWSINDDDVIVTRWDATP